eukprot:760227-Hanusia_phi.AAC.1
MFHRSPPLLIVFGEFVCVTRFLSMSRAIFAVFSLSSDFCESYNHALLPSLRAPQSPLLSSLRPTWMSRSPKVRGAAAAAAAAVAAAPPPPPPPFGRVAGMRMVAAVDARAADAPAEAARPSVFESLPELGERLGGTGKAKLVWTSIRAGNDPWTDEAVTEKARKKLKENFQEIPRVSHVTRASCGTIKLLIAMHDGME